MTGLIAPGAAEFTGSGHLSYYSSSPSKPNIPAPIVVKTEASPSSSGPHHSTSSASSMSPYHLTSPSTSKYTSCVSNLCLPQT